jgi:hypothetical protein
MRIPSSLLAVVAASIAALAPGQARALNSWTFTNFAATAPRTVASSVSGLEVMVFDVTATGVGLTRVTRMAFAVQGTVKPGELANFQLVYYPSGLAGPANVVGSNAGSAWAPAGRTASIVSIDLTSPIVVQGDFGGVFALRVDVNGAPSSLFKPRLQTVTVDSGGVEQNLADTEDLPLPGDGFGLN